MELESESEPDSLASSGASSCLLCSANLHRHGFRSGHTNPTANVGVDSDNLVRAWCQLFKLPCVDMDADVDMASWLGELLRRGTETEVETDAVSGTSLCGSCAQVIEEVKASWIQLNELYSRIERLREQIEGTLQTAVAVAAGTEKVSRRQRHKLLKALQAAERYEVDQEALRFINVNVDKGKPADEVFAQVEIEIKVEPDTEPDPDIGTNDDDNEWTPSSPAPSPRVPGGHDSDFEALNTKYAKHESCTHARRSARPLSPNTVSKLVDEISNGRRQITIPLKHVRWDVAEGHWITPHLSGRKSSPVGCNPKWLKARRKTAGRKSRKVSRAKSRDEGSPNVTRAHRRRLRPRPRLRTVRTLKQKLVSECSAAEVEVYQCRADPASCSLQFATELRRDAHEHGSHRGDPRPFKCKKMVAGSNGQTECGQAYRFQKGILAHQTRCHSAGATLKPHHPKIYCDQCNRIVQSEEGLRRHKARVHGMDSSEQHLCTECGKILRSKRGLETHMEGHALDPPFKCASCPMGFPNLTRLHLHELKEHKQAEVEANPEHRCRYCHKVFANKFYIKRHEVLKHGANHEEDGAIPPRHQCSWPGCSYRAFGKAKLKAHEARHKNERQFKCMVDGCGASYNDKYRLIIHARIHTNERPFKCTQLGCQSAFRSKEYLDTHVKVMHAKNSASGEGLKCVCDLCGKKFPIRQYLRRHLEKHRKGKIP